MDLELPQEIPELRPYREKPMDLSPFAIYDFVNLSEEERTTLIDACAQDLPGNLHDAFKIVPSDTPWTSLKTIVKHHVDHLDDRVDGKPAYDWFHLVVITSNKWKEDGILVVALDSGEGESELPEPDKVFLPANEAGSSLINLQIGNIGWYEVKEGAETKKPSEEAQLSPGDHEDTAAQSQRAFRDDAPDKKPAAGFYIGIYTTPDVEFEAVLKQIQPCYRSQPREDFICKFEGHVSASPAIPENLVTEAYKLHPSRCLTNRYLAKNVLVIADSEDVANEGLLLGSMDWWQQSKDNPAKKSITEVAELWKDAPSPPVYRRLKAQTPMLVPEICDVASGCSEFDGRRRTR